VLPPGKALVMCPTKVLLADFAVIDIRTRKFNSKTLGDRVSFSMTIFDNLGFMKDETAFAIFMESECDTFFALMEKCRFEMASITKRYTDSWIEVPVWLIAGSEEQEYAHVNQGGAGQGGTKRDADLWIEVPVWLIAGSEEHENAHENQ